MPFNGNGTFLTLAPPDFPAVAGETILASRFNSVIQDLVNGLSNTVTRDGQSPPTAHLPMAGYKHTGVAAAAASTDYARFDQVLPIASGFAYADFSNATLASRLGFRSSTLNGNTYLSTNPNGTATSSGYIAYNTASPTDSAFAALQMFNTDARLTSGKSGGGSYLPLLVYVGGSQRLRIDQTTGKVEVTNALDVGGQLTLPAGSVGAPALALGGTTDSGFYYSSGTIRCVHTGAAAFHIGTGWMTLGVNTSVNASLYLNNDSVATAGAAYGAFIAPKFTNDGTAQTDVRACFVGVKLADNGVAQTYSNYYGFNANTPTLTDLHASSTVTTGYQYHANDISDTRFGTVYGYRSAISKVAGKTRWNFYASGDAPSYFQDTHIADNQFNKQASPVAANTTSTLSTAALLGRLITTAPAGAVSLTLPSGTTLDAAVTMPNADFAFEWNVINTNGTNTSTIIAATGHTVVGNMAVAPNTSATFRSRKTATNTFITYRVS